MRAPAVKLNPSIPSAARTAEDPVPQTLYEPDTLQFLKSFTRALIGRGHVPCDEQLVQQEQRPLPGVLPNSAAGVR